MTHYTARAHYQGLVDWTADDIDHYADALRAEHRPYRTWVRGRRPLCRKCEDAAWPCAAYRWAEQWAGSLTRDTATQRETASQHT